MRKSALIIWVCSSCSMLCSICLSFWRTRFAVFLMSAIMSSSSCLTCERRDGNGVSGSWFRESTKINQRCCFFFIHYINILFDNITLVRGVWLLCSQKNNSPWIQVTAEFRQVEPCSYAYNGRLHRQQQPYLFVRLWRGQYAWVLFLDFFDVRLNFINILADLLDLSEELVHEALRSLLLDANGDIVIIALRL